MSEKNYRGAAREAIMKTGDSVETTRLIRSQKTGALLPRQGTFVRDIENLGRKLILIDFGRAGEEYLFPNEVLAETGNGQMINGYSVERRC